MLALLNSAVVTEPGTYRYSALTASEARALVRSSPWRSAIGHEATAQMLSELLEIDCPCVREHWRQQPGDRALVFRLKSRPSRAGELTRAEVEAIGCEWGLLERLA